MTKAKARPRTLSHGRMTAHSLDAGSIARLQFTVHALTQLGADAVPGTVVRRALTVYTTHLDKLLDLPRDHRKVQFEVYAAAHANSGDYLMGCPPLVFTLGELRPFSRIYDEWKKARPSPLDQFKKDVEHGALDE